MAFVVSTKRGTFEVRESFNTPEGPRSRTLAGFRELTDEVIENARAQSAKPPSPEQLRGAARRAGAPVAPAPADRAARELIAELAKGEELEPKLRHLLADALGDGWSEPASSPSATRSAAEWIAATPQQRGKTLEDLLLLADALPSGGRRGKPLRFPRLQSTHA
jgi:hypothetical protein